MTRDNVLIGCFDPNTKVVREDSVELTISVLSGRHLHRDGGWSQIYPFPTFLQVSRLVSVQINDPEIM